MIALFWIVLFGGLGFAAYLRLSHDHTKHQNERDIHRMIKNQGSISVNSTNPTNTSSTKHSSTSSELEKLVKMHKDGSLTDEEFEAAKKKVLNS